MRMRSMALALTLGLTLGVMGCGRGERETEAAEAMPPAEEAVEEAAAAPSFVEREFWLALAEEPGWHLNRSRELFVDGQNQQAAEEMEKVAAIMRFESRHSHSSRERELLLASALELREVAGGVRVPNGSGKVEASIEEIDRVSALAYRAIAAHQVTLGRDALEAGDARMAGLYIQETAKALEHGFQRGGIEMDNALEARLGTAQDVGIRLAQEGEGTRDEALAVLDNLDRAVEELTNVVTARRK